MTFQLIEAGLLKPDIIIIIKIVDTGYMPARPAQAPGGMIADKAGCAGDEDTGHDKAF
jgi:hypothetical protein